MKLNKLKELRYKKGFSQRDMAEALHVSQNAYSLIETGKTRLIDVERIGILSEKLAVTPVELGLFDEIMSSSDQHNTKNTMADNQNTGKAIETLQAELIIKNKQLRQVLKQNSALLRRLNLQK